MSLVLVLRITAGPSAGRALHVDSSLVLGRGDADVVIDDQEISRRHALIRAGGDWLEIEDLDSLNGTWVNGRIYDPASGSTYTCQLALDGDDRARLRGYVGIPLLGRTTTWTRVGAENRLCREEGR